MAKTKWTAIPGGRLKRWKASNSDSRCRFPRQTPPHWYRNHLNRRERRKSKTAIRNGEAAH